MKVPDQLQYESSVRQRYAVIAITGGVLVFASAVLQLAGPHPAVSELTTALVTANKRVALDIAGSVLNGLGLICFAFAASFLAICTRARREATSPTSRIAVLGGSGLAAASNVAYAIAIATKVHTFITTGDQTYEEAHHLTTGPVLIALQVAGEAAALMIAMGLFFIALQAMRVGLLTRFMGYLGLFVGALMIIPIIQVPIVQVYWFVALGILFAGRWPSGSPPAWQTGRAEAWPSSAEMREQRAARAPARSKAGAPAPVPTPGPVPTTRANTPKRKRKKRK